MAGVAVREGEGAVELGEAPGRGAGESQGRAQRRADLGLAFGAGTSGRADGEPGMGQRLGRATPVAFDDGDGVVGQ